VLWFVYGTVSLPKFAQPAAAYMIHDHHIGRLSWYDQLLACGAIRRARLPLRTQNCQLTMVWRAVPCSHVACARAKHGAPALEWDASIAATSQSWAAGCPNGHSGQRGLGENMAVSSEMREQL
jgi:hypothetical protein